MCKLARNCAWSQCKRCWATALLLCCGVACSERRFSRQRSVFPSIIVPLVYIDPGNVFVISLPDDVFEIKARYHNFIVTLLILTHILSYQDDIIVRSLFLPLFPKIIGWFWIFVLCKSCF